MKAGVKKLMDCKPTGKDEVAEEMRKNVGELVIDLVWKFCRRI